MESGKKQPHIYSTFSIDPFLIRVWLSPGTVLLPVYNQTSCCSCSKNSDWRGQRGSGPGALLGILWIGLLKFSWKNIRATDLKIFIEAVKEMNSASLSKSFCEHSQSTSKTVSPARCSYVLLRCLISNFEVVNYRPTQSLERARPPRLNYNDHVFMWMTDIVSWPLPNYDFYNT